MANEPILQTVSAGGRISAPVVTDRCDLRCTYCIPEGYKGFEEPELWLSFEEIERVIGAFAPRGQQDPADWRRTLSGATC